jgi:nitric oxide reductase subunit C
VVFRIWIGLFIAFAFYSWMVYRYGDDKNTEGIPDKQTIAGWKVWQDKNCQSCHQLYGLGGYMGPDLTNVSSFPGKDAGYLKSFIKHGTVRMPDFNLSDPETENIIAFLTWVDKSGKSKIPVNVVSWWGNYNLDKQ